MRCDADIATSKLIASLEAMGSTVEKDTYDAMTLEGKAAYSEVSNRYETALAQDTAFRNKSDIDSIASGKLKKLGAVGSWLTLSKDPGVILGEDFVKPLTDALQKHVEYTQANGANSDHFKQTVVPVVKLLKADIQDHFTDLGQINFANRYLSAWEQGGKFYNAGKDIFGIANYPAQTITRNLISNNPFIAAANVFEFMPKALGIYGVRATAQGMLDFIGATKGNFIGRIPELERRAVYDTPHNGLFGKFDLVNLTENPLRGLGYHVAQAAGKDGLEGVEKIAFKYRPGREPLFLLENGSAATVALMRFSIESAKMYGQWYKNIMDGNIVDGAYGLALFHVMTALQTGVASSIPAPLWGLMNNEQQQSIKDLDDALGSNLLKHISGVSIDPSRMQPAGGISLGLGYDLANTAIAGAYKGAKKGVAAMQDEDYTRAGVEFTKGLISVGQAFIPGLNTSVKKVGDIIGDTLTGDTAPEDVPGVAGKKFLGLELAQ